MTVEQTFNEASVKWQQFIELVLKMPKPKGRKARKCEDPLSDQKIQLLEDVLANTRISASLYESYLNTLCAEKCDRISKLYMDKLTSLPENVRNMTITEIIEMQEKENQCTSEPRDNEDTLRALKERNKMMSEKKKTGKKERKRSLSANAPTRPLPRPPTNTFSRLSRTVSDSSLLTPTRQNRLSNMAVTPKFNPSYPVSKMARIPKPGELVMSMSGSPLQNIVRDSGITLSLGQGKVLTISDETNLEKELIAEINEPLKKTIKNLREKLDKILQS
ncbi:uncharacterized protein TNIN_402401 [Trichonephila inaurata madagascariensis]|uniref:Borealin C-terminal domain-containing protein n=2 Tax=Trichonephila inaurata madagascariensis TaxID=2747483 RepID=A0A8X7CSE3_9ARAC|nr:uncharacterized protein TNIN_402401 [Trichonephila inaurata madagascariensis]